MLVPKGVEEALFKRVVDGWIFSAPNPWTFGRRHSYLVNDAQKADLGMRVRRGRYFRYWRSSRCSASRLQRFCWLRPC